MLTLRDSKYTTDLAGLKRIPVPVRSNVSTRWKGVQHGELAETILEELDRRKVIVTRQTWTVTAEGASMAGSLGLHLPDGMGIPQLKDMDYALGLQHSNNGRHALKFAVGAVVFVCTNGMVNGEFCVKRKHTSGLELQSDLRDGLDRYFKELRQVNASVEAMRIMSTRDIWHRCLVEAGQRGLMAWSHIGQVAEEFTHPTFSEFQDRSAWALYNAFTFVLQKSSPDRQFFAMNEFRKIILN